MKLRILLHISLAGLLMAAFISCDDGVPFNSNQMPEVDTTGTLQESASFPVGVGVDYGLMSENSTYANTVQSEFDNITAEYQMKQAPIVQDDGSFDYSTADQLVQTAQSSDMGVHGHTLIWHQNNNGSYLRSLVTYGGGEEDSPLITNGSLESGMEGWDIFNDTNVSFSATTNQAYDGNTSLLIENTGVQDNEWNAQVVSPVFEVPVEVGEPYEISFWIKADQSGAGGRLSTTEDPQYQGGFDVTEVWTQITWEIEEANVSGDQRVAFDMGTSETNNIYVDYVEVSEPGSGGSGGGGQDSTNVADFMQNYITSTVSRYAGEVESWDVVNEPLAAGGNIRSNPAPGEAPEGDIFYWEEFVGEDYIPLAFEWANQADPDADLYINDYNLETDPNKLSAMVELVNGLLEDGVPIDGIGTQMHININSSYSGIDNAFQQLASTGLNVKVTELDVKVNPDDRSSFQLTDQALSYQQIMYNYVVWSYMENVPEDQRAGITVWNLIDNNSWVVTEQGMNDYPTLFDSTYAKKPAYSGFKEGLNGESPNSN